MNLDKRIKIRKKEGLPVGEVIDAPKKYFGYYYINKKGALKFKKTNRKESLAYLTYYINSKNHLFNE